MTTDRDELRRLAVALRARTRFEQAQGIESVVQSTADRPPHAQEPLAATEPADAPSTARDADKPDRSLPELRHLLVAEAKEVAGCRRCRLADSRNRTVYGVGGPNADLCFVGEGPGFEEDRQGEPFVGRAGQLLDRMISAMGLTRPDVYICNTVKCRPPENRTPLPDEMEACSPFLRRQLEIVSPRIIVALGRPAAMRLLGTGEAMRRLRGRFHSYEGIPVMPTYHPAYLLRMPSAKRVVWEDLQEVMKRLGLTGAGGPA